MRKTIRVKGMHCKSCEILLSEAIADAGVKVLSSDFKKGEVVVDIHSDAAMAKIRAAVKGEGDYSVVE